ncbi:hypothetical protein C5B42_04995 [Candidatus Cerribacteria bacterium 'Amazon FNV 2010 28 9']|uniref:Glycosyltransferase 2-like domain-containing protein n=1 Tax=Candidatus Cerribacteria bacterium 'Amazon FNV 2010 28 9' TaxID=2081795 RepID=A0A317JP64_9BACT|nr:MAG: hypothetical protein C5B42_04995 [Candidatus Cerribacteria bacterium 'Amazon FNV 2010 28 9']
MNTWIIVPAYNEEKYIGRVLKKIQNYTHNIVVVVDGCKDASASIAKKHVDNVLIHETNLGKGAALKTGCEYVFNKLSADAVVFVDADDQHDPKELPRFFKALREYQFVFGVRNMGTTMPLFRFLGNKCASIWLNFLFGVYIPDIPSGYKGMTKKAYRKLKWKSRGYEVEGEIAALVAKDRIPFKILEIDTIYHDTEKGMTLLDAAHVGGCLLRWRVGL